MWQKKGFWQSKICLKIASYLFTKKNLIKKIHQRGENDTFFPEQTLYWFVMKDRQSSDPWGHKWCFERHFSWQVVHFQLSNWQGHRWAGLLMISQINQSKPIELRNQELLICYFVFFSPYLVQPIQALLSIGPSLQSFEKVTSFEILVC